MSQLFSRGIGVPIGAFEDGPFARQGMQDLLANPNLQAILNADPSNPILQMIGGNVSVPVTITQDFTDAYNAVMNGEFQIWQRNTSWTSIAHLTVMADRWRYHKQVTGAVHDVSRSQDVPAFPISGTLKLGTEGFLYSLKLDVQTADTSVGATDVIAIQQRIDPPQFEKFARRRLMLRFWVKSTKTGRFSVSLLHAADTLAFVSEYTVLVADTWEQKEIAIPKYSGTWTTGNVYVYFTLMAGTNYQTATLNEWISGTALYSGTGQVNSCDSVANNFLITGVSLQTYPGTIGYPHRSFIADLLDCMRYFQKSFRYPTVPADGNAWQLGAAVAPQVVAASTASPIILQHRLIVPLIQDQGAGGSTTVTPYGVTSAASGTIRNVTAAADCTSQALLTETGGNVNDNLLAWSATTPAGSAVGQIIALHWTVDGEGPN